MTIIDIRFVNRQVLTEVGRGMVSISVEKVLQKQVESITITPEGMTIFTVEWIDIPTVEESEYEQHNNNT